MGEKRTALRSITGIFAEHGREMVRRARRILRSGADADDAAQEVMLSLVRGSHAAQAIDRIRSWLFELVRSRCVDLIRSQRRRKEREALPDPVRLKDAVPDRQGSSLERRGSNVMTEPAIEAKEISFTYGKIEAVKDISFEVSPGEILGFLGPNGAGKSTTIKILTGQLAPRSGVARILGMDVSTHTSAVQARIGVCFEEKNLYLNMSARENLAFFASLFGIKKPDIDGLLSRVGLLERGRDRVAKYSKGMRQRLMVARALVNRPEVLFLDEPTDGLDPVSSRAIREVIREEATRGAAVLLTTHDMWEADELSHRVAFINEGTLHAVDTPENLKLEHGTRRVKVRRREGDTVREEEVDLDAAGAGERLKAAVDAEGLMTIHTEEATLESIFIRMTGRGLEG